MQTSRVFENQRIELGADQFEDCTFRRCLMVVDGRPVHLPNCVLEECGWTFEGHAGHTLNVVRTLCSIDFDMARVIGVDLGLLPKDDDPKN